jgi:hypothetical protein
MPKDFTDLNPVSDAPLVTEDSNTNRNDKLTIEELTNLLQTGKPLDFKDRYISDEVNLKGVKFLKPIEVQNLECTAEVNFSGARFERAVNFTGCRFQKLNLADARVEGTLILNEVVIGSETDHKLRRQNRRSDTEPQSSPPVVADFTNLRVAGCFSLMNATVYGSLSCTQADIEDDFRLDETQIHGDVRLRRAHFGEFCTDAKQRTVNTDAADKEPHRLKRPCRVDGKLDLTSARVAGDVRLIAVLIGGELGLQAAAIDGNFLCRARAHVCTWLNNGAWLLGVRVAGVADFTGCHVRGRLNFDDANVGKRVDFIRSRLDGDAHFSNTQVEHNANFTACHVRGNLILDGAKIGNNLSLDGALVEGNLQLQNASIGNSLFIRTTRLQPNPEEILRCQITKTAWLLGATIVGDVDISGVRIGKGLVMQNVNIGQNFMAVIFDGFPTHIHEDVHLNGVRIRGGAEFGGAILGGDLNLDGANIEGGFKVTFTLNDTDDWRIERAQLGGRIYARSATIGKHVLLLGLTARALQFSEGDLKDPGALALKLQNARDPLSEYLKGRFTPATQQQLKEYDGSTAADSLRKLLVDGINELLKDASLFDEQRFKHVTLSDETRTSIQQRLQGDLTHFNRLLLEEAYPSEIAKKEKGIDFGGAHINGEFSLYSTEVVKEFLLAKRAELQGKGLSGERERQLLAEGLREFTEIEGDLRLTRTRVLGDVTLDGVTINGKLDMRDANVRANIKCRPIESDNRNPVRASVLYADFETLDMIGDMNLTGLDIKGKKEDGSDGDLTLRDSQIRGRLELCAPEPAQNENGITSIGGALRLNAAEISHAIITGDNLAGADNRGRIPSLWEELKTARREGDWAIMFLLRGGPREKETPARVEFERAVIGRLQIFEPFPGTLDLSNLKVDSWDWPKDHPRYFNDMLTKSHPFKKSNYLAIEKALRNRGEDEQADEVHVLMRQRDRRQTKGLWRVLFDRFLYHSIKYGTTSTRLTWLMILWFAGSLLIFSDRNRVEYEVSPQVDKPITTKHPDAWSRADAAFFAARLHVPIISLGVEDKVEPSGAWTKAYAILVVGASWVMWPLLIASVSGLIRKRD